MILEYDGTNFYGWQRQSHSRSVQGEIEKVLSKILKTEVTIDGAGRTDAGVHAFGQVATFGADLPMGLKRLRYVMNNFLPKDIRVVELSFEEDEFHARYSAIGKTYVYKVINGEEANVFTTNYRYHYPYKIEDEKIKEAIALLEGTHDFSSFMASGSSAQNPIRTIHNIEYIRQGDLIDIVFTGDGFLYKMVRLLTAFLLEIGQGRIPISVVEKLLKNPTRQYTSKVAPAMGLYLKAVYYENDK